MSGTPAAWSILGAAVSHSRNTALAAARGEYVASSMTTCTSPSIWPPLIAP
ncbi:hypothetical protein [Streptomyces sp. JJ38]|uniref:hypothetical protein n=1 Tax=Streptomyces sp. JJ38 TaxID=2738128 RepID=UPI001C55CF9C|nr:hypothetical protein [Streptomyces sp. JJ38]MBW1597246.1 hypothetical protein [Streptomyces sp. JJ38]